MFVNFVRKFSSSVLYVTADKANKTFAVLTPYINFHEYLNSCKNIFYENLCARRLSSVDVNELQQKWLFFQDLTNRKKSLEASRVEIGQSITHQISEQNSKENIDKLKLHLKLIKDELKHLKDYYHQVEENVMLEILNLPNELHARTPKGDTNFIVYEYLQQEKEKVHNHLQSELIEYVNPWCCYLKSDAALFEINTINSFSRVLLENNFTQFSNSDFVRSLVIEGCGHDFNDNKQVITLELMQSQENTRVSSRLHLVGAGTIYPFMAYFTKHSIVSTQLPIKLFSIGRNYQPVNHEVPKGLFNLAQQNVLNVFIATTCETDDETLFKEVLQILQNLYKGFKEHFRLILVPASKLAQAESLRMSIEIFSNGLQEYVEIGNISFYNDYLSKRLLFNYKSSSTDIKFTKITAGTLLNVHKLLGCLLESSSFKFVK